jgi:hypothetical protein
MQTGQIRDRVPFHLEPLKRHSMVSTAMLIPKYGSEARMKTPRRFDLAEAKSEYRNRVSCCEWYRIKQSPRLPEKYASGENL